MFGSRSQDAKMKRRLHKRINFLEWQLQRMLQTNHLHIEMQV